MNKIRLYRGKRIDNIEWVYGYYLVNENINEHKIHKMTDFGVMGTYIIKPETVGQLVENHISFGKRFQGDIIKAYRRDDVQKKNPCVGEITYLNGCFMALNCTWHELFKLYQSDFEVIGNVTDNSNLLEKQQTFKN